MRELESLGTAHTKKSYLSRGVREPLFGVATGAMKPLKKRIGVNQALADELWATGNYDAMYFAGMIADVDVMTEADFDRWMDASYGPMLSDLVVSVTLAESDLAQSVAGRWIRGGDEERAAAGWACYEWLLGWRPDEYFEPGTIRALLDLAAASVHEASPRLKRAMNKFIIAVGVSYRPLHDEALNTAEAIGLVEVASDGVFKPLASAADQIRAAAGKGTVGFKRRAVRC
ncbi:MAG: DNA alkylation repair protein [Coriobacteriia bacterium]|nr:DNA alkylation repair protein [Coriobacteriia bacterium]